MNSELRQYIQQQGSLDLASVRHVQARLPDAAELDSWLEEVVAEHSALEFILLAAAAIIDGRTVDARHLVKGARLMPRAVFSHVGLKMTGNVAEYLMQALQQELLEWEPEQSTGTPSPHLQGWEKRHVYDSPLHRH